MTRFICKDMLSKGVRDLSETVNICVYPWSARSALPYHAEAGSEITLVAVG